MFYSNTPLDRADHLRSDGATLKTLFESERALLLPVWRGKLLVGDKNNVAGDSGPAMITIPVTQCPASADADLFLGLLDTTPVFARSLSSLEEPQLTSWLSLAQTTEPEFNAVRFDDLRVIGPALNANDGALMAYARGLLFWHDSCQFCSRCGHALHSINGGHAKTCDNSACNYQSFPRTDPAVIMLVTHDATNNAPAQCLLGRNAAWPKGVFSTLAGFVETGESLEQGVQREVFEEANIRTENVRYIASQPWPFPRSIMLGFEATATSTEITIDPKELDDARWFTAEELKTFGTWGDEQYEFQLPRTDSIARFLIDRWIKEHELTAS